MFPFDQHIAKCASIEVFHHQVGDLTLCYTRKTKISNVDNVRVSQSTSGARFAFEAFDEFFVPHKLRSDQFQSNIACGTEMGSEIDRAHTARAKQMLKPVLVV